MKKSTSWVLKIGILVIVVVCFLLLQPLQTLVKRIIFLFAMLDVSAIKGYLLSYGIWAPVVSFLLMIFQSVLFPLPSILITFANAALFGWVKGAILSWSSAMVGACLCFYLARFYGRDVVEKLTSKLALDSVDDFFEKYGNHTILICRLLPFVSFDLVSYAAGLTSMSFWSFFWATGIGQLPATIVYSYVGDMLVGGAKTLITAVLIMVAVFVLGIMLKKIIQDKNAKKISEPVEYGLDDKK